MKNYIKYFIWEFLLCLAAAAALLLNFSKGFYVPLNVANSISIALALCGAVLLFCFIGGYNRVTRISFPIIFLALAALGFLRLRSLGIDIVDEEGSSTAVYIYWIGGIAISTIGYLLTRSGGGTAVLLILGAWLNAILVFLEYDVSFPYSLVFVIAAATIYILKNYRSSALNSRTIKPKFGTFSLNALGTVGISAVLGMLIFLLLIKPLNLPTVSSELLTRIMRYDVLELVGIAKHYPIPDELLQTDETEDERQDEHEDELTETPEPTEIAPETAEQGFAEQELGNSLQNTESYTSVSYSQKITPFIAASLLLILLMFALIPQIKKRLAARRMAKFNALPECERYIALYQFLLKKLAVIGFVRRNSQTESEFAALMEERIEPYTTDTENWNSITKQYLSVRYGGIAPELDIRSVYPTLVRNYRKLNGNFRYLLKYFRL